MPTEKTDFDGLAFFLEHTDADNVFDIVSEQTSWPPLYTRVFDPPVPVESGRHRIRVVVESDCSLASMYYAFVVSVLEGENAVITRTVRLQLS